MSNLKKNNFNYSSTPKIVGIIDDYDGGSQGEFWNTKINYFGICNDIVNSTNKKIGNTDKYINCLPHDDSKNKNDNMFQCLDSNSKPAVCCEANLNGNNQQILYKGNDNTWSCGSSSWVPPKEGWYCTNPDNNTCTSSLNYPEPKQESYPLNNCTRTVGHYGLRDGPLQKYNSKDLCELKCFNPGSSQECAGGYRGWCHEISSARNDLNKDPTGTVPILGPDQHCDCPYSTGTVESPDDGGFGGCAQGRNWAGAIRCVKGTKPTSWGGFFNKGPICSIDK